MIKFISQTNTFHIQGKNVSYVFCVDAFGFLRHLHFGEKLPVDENLLHLTQTAYLGAAVNFDGAKLPMDNLNAMMLENSVAQMGDYRQPSISVALSNGSTLTDFRYASHKILKNHTPDGMPHARGGETLQVDLTDSANMLTLSLFYTVFDDCDVIVRSCTLKNNGKSAVCIQKLSSFCLDLPCAHYDTVQLVGNWASERQVVRKPCHSGILQVNSGARGVSSHCYNPFLALVQPSATETSGECYGVNLVYSGSFSLTAENNTLGSTRLQGGIFSDNFRWQLAPNESFCAPQAVLAYSACGIGEMSRVFHNFYRQHLINPKFAHAVRPIVVNNWEATYFNFDTEKLLAIVDCAKELGIDTFVLDDGWFTNRADDTNGLGDWQQDSRKLSGGLRAISDHCHKYGMKFGLWVEPEMVNEGTRLFAEHPEWVLANPGGARVRGRNQLVLDFANTDVVEHIFGKIQSVIAQNNVDYIKWDMNRYLADVYSVALPSDRQGEVLHRYVLGVYSLAEKLLTAFPDLFIEGCAGGGGRFDAGMLYYCPQIWTSDNTDAYSRSFIQYGTSMCYPCSSMSAHVSACPNHQMGRITSLDARYNVASTCSFGYELDITKLSDDEKQSVKLQIAQYKSDSDLVLNGDLYRLTDPRTDNLWAVCQVNKDKSKARLTGMYGLIMENVGGKLLKIDGLDDAADYKVVETGMVVSGKALRTAGLLLPQIFTDFETFSFHLEKQ